MNYWSNTKPAPDLTECFRSPGGHDLFVDAFVPDDATHNGAAVICVHGGGWYAGSRQAFLWHAHRLSLRGYMACTIDYRLSQTAPFPAALVDCQSAVGWLRRQAARFGVGADRIGAMGSSAGGHLAACLGVFENAAEDVSVKVNCVVDVHGMHDFVSYACGNREIPEYVEAFLGGGISETKELWRQASPALHVDRDSAPMLLVHDPGDTTVSFEQSLILASALMTAARPMRFLPSPGSGHGFVYNPEHVWTQRLWPLAMNWLDDHLLNGVGSFHGAMTPDGG